LAQITIEKIFLTGIDEKTDLNIVKELTEEYPCVVWGVLISSGRAGKLTDKRYPSLNKIEEIKEFIVKNNLRENFGIHICGKELINDFFVSAYDTDGMTLIKKYFNYFKYIQLNFNTRLNELYKHTFPILKQSQSFCDSNIIVQYNDNNKNAYSDICQIYGDKNYFYDLIDFSGGNGIYKDINDLLGSYSPRMQQFGIAGGISLDNISDVIKAIEKYDRYNQHEYYNVWIDMESNLRLGDNFSLDICRSILATHKKTGLYYDSLRHK